LLFCSKYVEVQKRELEQSFHIMKETEEFYDCTADTMLAVKKLEEKIMPYKRCGQLSKKIFVYSFILHSMLLYSIFS